MLRFGARLLAEAVKQANDAILEYADAHKNTSGMGTTLVAARFADGMSASPMSATAGSICSAKENCSNLPRTIRW